MLRNRAVALIVGLAASPLVIALGLGPLKSDSFLNETFSGRIEILGGTAEDFDNIRVGLASADQFERAGIAVNPLLYRLRFAVNQDENGGDYITVTSREPVREPYLNFLLEVNWANGRLLREYTVLLDPPLYDPSRRQPQPVAVAAAPSPAADADETPAAEAPVATPEASAAGGSFGGDGTYGPVVATDTLWSIAERARPDESVTVQQMMLALLRTNPEAFGENNINLLRRGAVLRMPEDSELGRLGAREAFDEVRRQHQLWEEYRGQVAASPAAQPYGAAAPATGSDYSADTDSDGRLELVAPGGADSAGTPGTGTGAGTELLQEAVDAQSQQNAELQSKLLEAEEIIDLLQRQVNIKDEELAALQARLAELGVEMPTLPGDGAATDDADVATADDAMVEDAMGDDADAGPPADDEAASDAMADDATVADDAAPDMVAEPDGATGDDAMDDEMGDAEPAADVASDMDAGDDGAAIEPPAAPRSFPANLIPEHIASMVPGGAMTILGVVAVAILALFAAVVGFLMRSRGDKAEAAAAAVEIDEEAPTEFAQDSDDTDATAAPDEDDDDDSEAPTEIGAGGGGDDFDPNATVEATAADDEFDANATVEAEASEDVTEQAAAAEPEEDPLEEVNIYLAYEQFDQAEELVTRVIGEYPDRHEYKLRLLEVYYSSNNLGAYETAARTLHDAVGEDDALWGSAVAMWEAMSPDRALFEGGEAPAAEAPQDDAKAFVDITGDAEAPAATGEDTVAHAPGDDDDGVDFDLASGDEEAAPAESEDDGVLDLTATADGEAAAEPAAEDEGVLDLTAADDGDDVLDLTATADENDMLDLAGDAGGDDDVLDLTDDGDSGDDVLDLTGDSGDDDVLDLTGDGDAGDDDVLDLTDDGDAGDDVLDLTGEGGGDDVLDIGAGDDDILDLTAGGAADDDLDEIDLGSGADDDALEIDLGGGDGDDGVLDLTGGDTPDADGEADLLDVTAGGTMEDLDGDLLDLGDDDGADLLDVTKTGDISDVDGGMDDTDLLNVTSPGLGDVDDVGLGDSDETADGLEITDITGDAPAPDFDISETVATAFDDEADAGGGAGDDMLDLTGGDAAAPADDGDGDLDFDIGGLEEDGDGSLPEIDTEATTTVDSEAPTLVDSEEISLDDADGGIDLDITMDSDGLSEGLDGGGDLDLDISGLDDETPEDADISLQGADLDISGGDGEEDFDFALDGTAEMDSIAADETLDMGSVVVEDSAEGDDAASLEELSAQLDSAVDDGGLDDLDIGALEIEGAADDGDDALDTVALDLSDGLEVEEEGDDKTVVMPVGDDIERQSDADETDTKLNLAKAYIELGDNDGARSILDEVAAEGNDAQKAEAQGLLSQLDG